MSTEYDVVLYLYDISHGMAKTMGRAMLGKDLEAIWHTGIICYGYEYFYGGGIQYARPGQTPAGQPLRVVALGKSRKTMKDFHNFLHSIHDTFSSRNYDLMEHNCNHFTSACARFLLGGFDIPQYIRDLPGEVLSTPLGQMFKPMFSQMRGPSGPATVNLSLPFIGNEGVHDGRVKYGEYSMYHGPNAVPEYSSGNQTASYNSSSNQTASYNSSSNNGTSYNSSSNNTTNTSNNTSKPREIVEKNSGSLSGYTTVTATATAATTTTIPTTTTTTTHTFSTMYTPHIPAFHKPNHTLALMTGQQRKDSIAAPLRENRMELKDQLSKLTEGRVLDDAEMRTCVTSLLTVVGDGSCVGISLLPVVCLAAWSLQMTGYLEIDSAVVYAAIARLETMLPLILKRDALQMTSEATSEMMYSAVFGLLAVLAHTFPLMTTYRGSDTASVNLLIQLNQVTGSVKSSLDCITWTCLAAVLFAAKTAHLLVENGADHVDDQGNAELLVVLQDAGVSVATYTTPTEEPWGETIVEILLNAVNRLDAGGACDELYHVLGLCVTGNDDRKALLQDLHQFNTRNPQEQAVLAMLE